MEYCKARVTKLMTEYFDHDFRRINHALEVLRYSEEIMKEYDSYDREIVITSALLHDIGIKKSEELHGYNNGKTQEEYGPDVARDLLESIGFSREKTDIICNIIGNHHSPNRYDYNELKILKRADAIVNREESSTP